MTEDLPIKLLRVCFPMAAVLNQPITIIKYHN